MKMTRQLKLLSAALACAALAACGGGGDTPTQQPASGPFAVTLQSGAPSVIASEGLSLTLTAVDDSRCPAAAICVWAGEAVARIGIVQNGQAPAALSLSTAPDKGTGSYRGYRVNLIGVEPYPITTTPIPLDQYRINLRIDKS
jgi:hypothetical protein